MRNFVEDKTNAYYYYSNKALST